MSVYDMYNEIMDVYKDLEKCDESDMDHLIGVCEHILKQMGKTQGQTECYEEMMDSYYELVEKLKKL